MCEHVFFEHAWVLEDLSTTRLLAHNLLLPVVTVDVELKTRLLHVLTAYVTATNDSLLVSVSREISAV